jgi:hypothetical protein
MKIFNCIVSIQALFLINLLNASEPTVEDGVIVLNDTNFDEELVKHKSILVEFYAPWWYS